MIKVKSRWVGSNGKLFVVDNVQDGVVWYSHGKDTYSCNEGAFVERFKELVQ